MFSRQFAGAAAILFLASGAWGQTFDLTDPTTGTRSVAEITARSIVVTDAAGGVTTYTRDAANDAVGFIAFSNLAFGQVIRWPTTPAANFHIGTVVAGRLTFRVSNMVISKRAVAPPIIGGPIVPPAGLVLTVNNRTADTIAIYYLDAATGAAVKYFDLRAGEVKKQDTFAGHRWQAVDSLGRSVAYTVPSVVNPVWDLGGAAVVPPPPLPPVIPPVVPQPVLPTKTLVSRRLVPNKPLEPVTIEMSNSYSKEIWVLITNREDKTSRKKIIAAGETAAVEFDRDAGGTLQEIYDIRQPTGLVERVVEEKEVPPKVLYDVSVYKLITQSVSIDRTGPKPRIDDVTRVPSSVGWFVVPAGAALKSGKSDVYATALSRKNSGGVRPIDPADWKTGAAADDPFESRLEAEFGPLPE